MGERVLPTADELAQVHSADSLKDLQRLALLLDDQPVIELLGLAQVRRMRIDLDAGLHLPELAREKEARWREYQAQAAMLRYGLSGVNPLHVQGQLGAAAPPPPSE